MIQLLLICVLSLLWGFYGFMPRITNSVAATRILTLRTPGLKKDVGIPTLFGSKNDFPKRTSMPRGSSFLGNSRFKRVFRRLIIGLTAVMLPFIRLVKSAVAATSKSDFKGWDLYGRVPYDDFLFTNWALTNPNLLKRSYTETIVQELPAVLGNFKRRKRINELTSVLSGLGYFAVTMAAIGLLYKVAMAANLRRSKAEEEMGRGFSASAISKNSARKGKAIEGMEEGWIDMEEDDDDDSPPTDEKK